MPESAGEKPPTPLHILIADDDDSDRKQIKRSLHQSGLPCVCAEVISVEDALEASQAHPFDCAIIDYHLNGQDGLAGISLLHERFPYLAIIMNTGQGDELVAVQAIQRGAMDYTRKNMDAQSIRRSVENAVAKASLLRTVDQQRKNLEVFSRVLVHDLTSPIHSVLGFAALIEEDIEAGNPADVALYCRKVIRGLEAMAALIDALRHYSSSEQQIPLAPVEMRDVMIDTLGNLERVIRNRRAQVTYGELPRVLGTAQLGQLLQNLIANSVKFCEAPIPLVHVSAQPLGGNFWQFSVKDNGIGIPEMKIQEVFQPFQRLHSEPQYEGTGLGLATCRNIVERHGGIISCQSVEGCGTTFLFTLKAA